MWTWYDEWKCTDLDYENMPPEGYCDNCDDVYQRFDHWCESCEQPFCIVKQDDRLDYLCTECANVERGHIEEQIEAQEISTEFNPNSDIPF